MRRSVSRACGRRQGSLPCALLAVGLLACAPRPSESPQLPVRSVDPLTVEVAAARHLLERYADLEIEIQPAFTDAVSSPGSPGPTLRDSARTVAIASALGARVAERSRGRSRAHKTAEVLLSEPHVRGDTATITGTIWWHRDARPRSGSGYETSALTLLCENDRWRVVRVEVLGQT